ncbi:MAG: alpha/beta hydrolase [Desulfosalsimonadaceae bacterium]
MELKTDTLSKAVFLDRPDIHEFLFHPRKASGMQRDGRIEEIVIEVTDGAAIGCRLHLGAKEYPTLLFFHGNGEIAHDYDPVGPLYLSGGLNFVVADYRGYGISTGVPTITSMLSDAYATLDHVIDLLDHKGHTGPLWIMGRSLGSAPAIEVAVNRQDAVSGLIVESGFAGVKDLLERLGIWPQDLHMDDDMLFSNADSIMKFKGPVLVIHAENDHIIPLAHGKQLYESAPGPGKAMKIILGADHNNIFALAGMKYFEYIKQFVYELPESGNSGRRS